MEIGLWSLDPPMELAMVFWLLCPNLPSMFFLSCIHVGYAQRLAARHINVILVGRNEEKLANCSKELEDHYHVLLSHPIAIADCRLRSRPSAPICTATSMSWESSSPPNWRTSPSPFLYVYVPFIYQIRSTTSVSATITLCTWMSSLRRDASSSSSWMLPSPPWWPVLSFLEWYVTPPFNSWSRSRERREPSSVSVLLLVSLLLVCPFLVSRRI